MKKIIIKKLLTMYAVLFFVHSADAFNSNKTMATGHDSPNVKTRTASLSNANKKAVEDFNKRVSNPVGNWWAADKNGFISYFKEDGYTSHIGYDKKGNWVYSMILYNESKLPKDVRANVKSVYYDMAIVLVKEIQTVNGKGYVINLEDKTTIRIVKLNEQGEMETIQEIIK
jgi:hypothetical protein